jgi:CubicO group peptidase (beta-lactamase class C family)
MITVHRVLPALLAFLLAFLIAAPTASAAVPTEATLNTVDTYVQAAVKTAHIPGLAVGIVQDQQVVFLKGYGTAGGGRPVTPDTPMIIGSTSKSFTALAVMQLVEAGRVDLDAPVQTYLPEFRTAAFEASKCITVRELLNHTSGFSTWDGRQPMLADGPRALADVTQNLKDVRLHHAPGQTYEYSNLNYLILGALVEKVSGQPYGTYLRANVLEPLQMRSSGTSPAEVSNLAAGYHMWFGFGARANEPFLSDQVPAGYIMASARDLSNYLIAQLNEGSLAGRSVLSPAGIAAMHTPSARVSDRFQYGMGWLVGQKDGATVVRHDGEVADFHSELYTLPDSKTGIVLIANVTHMVTSAMLSRMPVDIAGLLTGASVPQATFWQRTTWLWYRLMYLAVVVALLLMPIGWRRLPEHLRRANRLAQLLRVGVTVVINLVLGVGIWLGAPLVMGASWSLMFHFGPDLAWLAAAVAGMNLLGAVVRLGITFGVSRRPVGAAAGRV